MGVEIKSRGSYKRSSNLRNEHTITCTYFTLDIKQVSLVLSSCVFEHGAEDVWHAVVAPLGGGSLSHSCRRRLILVLQMPTGGGRSIDGVNYTFAWTL